MMFKTLFADVVQQPLHLGNLDHTGAAERVQTIIGEAALTDIAAHSTRSVVGRETREAHLFRLNQPNTGAKGILLANGAGDDFLEVHFHRTEEVLGKVRAMK